MATEYKGFGTNPVCNTGFPLQGVRLGLDYLTFTGKQAVAQVQEIICLVAAIFECDRAVVWEESRAVTRGRYYDHSARLVNGGDAAWSAPGDDGLSSYRISIPGQVINRVPVLVVLEMILYLHKTYKINWTRIDIKLDDYSKRLDLAKVRAAAEDGNYLRFRAISYHEDQRKKGRTQYFGSPESDKRMRFYDKDIESKGMVDSKRIELQLREERAQIFMENLIEMGAMGEEEILQFMTEAVLAAIDFRDRSQDSNVSRCPRLDWWNEFLEYCKFQGGIRFSSPRKESSVAKKMVWIRRQVETTISIFRDILGEDGFDKFIQTCIYSGRKRYRAEHRAHIQQHYHKLDSISIQTC